MVSTRTHSNLGLIIGTTLTVLLYTVSVVVWGIRLEGRITNIEWQKLQDEKRLDIIEETGTKPFRTQMAIMETKIAEILKGFTPYGVQNLENRVKDIEVTRAATVAEVNQRLKKLEEQSAKIDVLEQRVAVTDEKGTKDMPQIQRRLNQVEIQLDNQRMAGQSTPATRRIYEDRW